MSRLRLGRRADEVTALGAADLAALATVIAGRAFAVSDRPTPCDATLYGFLANIISVPLESPLQQAARQHATLTDHVERMRLALERV